MILVEDNPSVNVASELGLKHGYLLPLSASLWFSSPTLGFSLYRQDNSSFPIKLKIEEGLISLLNEALCQILFLLLLRDLQAVWKFQMGVKKDLLLALFQYPQRQKSCESFGPQSDPFFQS